MNDQPFADDSAPHEDPRRFELPADSAADDRFLRRQRRRRLSELTGQDHEPDPLEDLLDADEDRGDADDLAAAANATPAALVASEAQDDESTVAADVPAPDAAAPDSVAADSVAPDSLAPDGFSASSPEVIGAFDPFDPEGAAAPEAENGLADRDQNHTAGPILDDDADDGSNVDGAGDTDDIDPSSPGFESDNARAASSPPAAMPSIGMPSIGMPSIGMPPVAMPPVRMPPIESLPAPRSLDGTALPQIDRFTPDQPESAEYSSPSPVPSPDGYELPAGLPADAPGADDAADSPFANFDWGASGSASPPIGPLPGEPAPGAGQAISLQPTLSAEDDILAAAIQKAGVIAEAVARPCSPQAEAVAQEALDRAEAALRKTEAVETELHAYVDAMRQELLLAAAQWRVANGRG